MWQQDEKLRVEFMEEFDEFEEWVVKCSHYVTTIGSQDAVHGGHFFDPMYAVLPKFVQKCFFLQLPLAGSLIPDPSFTSILAGTHNR
jgi:hypothetical protein